MNRILILDIKKSRQSLARQLHLEITNFSFNLNDNAQHAFYRRSHDGKSSETRDTFQMNSSIHSIFSNALRFFENRLNMK